MPPLIVTLALCDDVTASVARSTLSSGSVIISSMAIAMLPPARALFSGTTMTGGLLMITTEPVSVVVVPPSVTVNVNSRSVVEGFADVFLYRTDLSAV